MSPIFLRRHWLATIILFPFTCFFLLQGYWFVLRTFYDYEVGTDFGMAERQLERALETHNPDYCRRIIVTSLMPGPARYDLVNGCYDGYASKTGDVSLCMGVLDPGGCVEAIAKDRNDASLCEQAINPRRSDTDRRGSCFGYFAGQKRDYGYCERLSSLSQISEHQKILCYVKYIEASKDYTICPRLEAIHYIYNNETGNQELQSKQYSIDQCYKFAARTAKNSSICANIHDQKIRSECYEQK